MDKKNIIGRVCKYLLKIDCKLIDLIPEFQKFKDINKNWLTELYFLNDEHFNESGANFLYKNIIKYLN